MDKLRLGTIGTSWITDSFIEAALESEKYTLQCVYSRGAEKAKEFAGKYGDITIETDLEFWIASLISLTTCCFNDNDDWLTFHLQSFFGYFKNKIHKKISICKKT